MEEKVYNIDEIMKMLPHRYPFLLVDRLIVEEPGEKGIGIKNLTMNELFFQGHFPGNPIMPGVLQIEAMAQAAGCIVMAAEGDYETNKRSVLFMSVDGVKFRKPVRPGDQLKMHLEKVKVRHNIFVFKGVSKVDDQVVSEAELTAMIIGDK
ncbi:MAG: 3-hydroxyacyl-ACP dehydratase FabZ [Alphaproteobacteria bacterium]|nr:3-hydroxyacyl-ACP dehydratase FabZ [Alphaproteobacteria bacterium]